MKTAIFSLAAMGLVISPAVLMADEAPLPAGGPAAQTEAAGFWQPGTIIEVGGVLFAVTIAGLIALNQDSGGNNSPVGTSAVPPSTTNATSGT